MSASHTGTSCLVKLQLLATVRQGLGFSLDHDPNPSYALLTVEP